MAAARLVLAGEIDGLTTPPLHKGALRLAGHAYPGHTELLAELCGVERFAMCSLSRRGARPRTGGLAIVHVTLHMRCVRARRRTTPAVLTKIVLVDEVMRRLAGSPPRIGVFALVPTPAKTGCLAMKKPASFGRPSSKRPAKDFWPSAPCRPTR